MVHEKRADWMLPSDVLELLVRSCDAVVEHFDDRKHMLDEIGQAVGSVDGFFPNTLRKGRMAIQREPSKARCASIHEPC